MASLRLFREPARHRAPGPTRYTHGASLRARTLGVFHRLFSSQDSELAPYDVGPELFGGNMYRAPWQRTGAALHASEHVCGPACHPDHLDYRQCFSDAYAGRQAAQRGEQAC